MAGINKPLSLDIVGDAGKCVMIYEVRQSLASYAIFPTFEEDHGHEKIIGMCCCCAHVLMCGAAGIAAGHNLNAQLL